MSLTRLVRKPNFERWYMYPGNIYDGEAYTYTQLDVFIWETDEIYILTVTDIPEDVLYKNEELITDIEGLAHHLNICKGSEQLFEFYDIDMSDFTLDEQSEDSDEVQIQDYRANIRYKFLKEYVYPKYKIDEKDMEQASFRV